MRNFPRIAAEFALLIWNGEGAGFQRKSSLFSVEIDACSSRIRQNRMWIYQRKGNTFGLENLDETRRVNRGRDTYEYFIVGARDIPPLSLLMPIKLLRVTMIIWSTEKIQMENPIILHVYSTSRTFIIFLKKFTEYIYS